MNDALSTSMFWVGALMVAAPLVFFGIVIAVWAYQKRRNREVRSEGPSDSIR